MVHFKRELDIAWFGFQGIDIYYAYSIVGID